MKDLFSIGELAKYQKISKQTLIFYDKIGLFRPAWVDPDNGYRYYSAAQLDELDAILIMKRAGFSLKEIQAHLADHTIDSSLVLLRRQLVRIQREIDELSMIRSRLQHRCDQLERADAFRQMPERVFVGQLSSRHILYEPVEPPFSFQEISIATKKCYAASFEKQLPTFLQCGVRVPLERLRQGQFTQAAEVFLLTENTDLVPNVRQIPGGRCASIYHFGDYASIGVSYQKLLRFCDDHALEIVSDSYEFCVNDYLFSFDESEFITQIVLFVRDGP